MDLDQLFDALTSQPMGEPALWRACRRIEEIARIAGLHPGQYVKLVKNSEVIEKSKTMNWFQEMVLGSEVYRQTFQKSGELEVKSYLHKYDEPLVNPKSATGISSFLDDPETGAAIMTNRPSNTLLGLSGTPEDRKSVV